VHLTGIIGKDGLIQQLQVIDGPPMLVQAAVDAVRQWVYRPTLLSNKPVEVIAPINVNFTLSQ
jgi:protein TonB